MAGAGLEPAADLAALALGAVGLTGLALGAVGLARAGRGAAMALGAVPNLFGAAAAGNPIALGLTGWVGR